MTDRWLPNRRFNPEKVTDQTDFTKRHAGLSHPPRPRVHSEQQGSNSLRRILFEIRLVRFPGVDQWVVDTGSRRRKME